MTRRALILAAPQTIAAPASDPFDELARVWNPFAEKRNRGVLDLKLWKRVVAQVNKIEGRTCPERPII